MTRTAFNRHAARLALLAALLLGLLPAAGRLASGALSTSHAGPADAATVEGTGHAQHAGQAPGGGMPAPDSHHGDGDCAYCPLLASLLTGSPATAVATVAIGLRHRHALQPPPATWRRHPTGLGSRGPPLTA